MKALTLHQPWASLVALGEKMVETRSWGTSYRGPIAIHAGKALPPNWSPFKSEHFVNVLEPLVGVNEYGAPDLRKLPTGVIVAFAVLQEVHRLVPPLYEPGTWALSNQEHAFGNYGPGRYGWVLADVKPLAPPYYAVRGQQRLWELPSHDVMAASNLISDCSKHLAA